MNQDSDSSLKYQVMYNRVMLQWESVHGCVCGFVETTLIVMLNCEIQLNSTCGLLLNTNMLLKGPLSVVLHQCLSITLTEKKMTFSNQPIQLHEVKSGVRQWLNLCI